jgi:hypothetical protein
MKGASKDGNAVQMPSDYKQPGYSSFPRPEANHIISYGLNMFSLARSPDEEGTKAAEEIVLGQSTGSIHDKGRFWIPDDKCKFCRGCGLAFTAFLRSEFLLFRFIFPFHSLPWPNTWKLILSKRSL